jgi:hypothetical protein
MAPLSPMVSRFFLEITVQAFIDPYACVHSLTFFHLQSIKKTNKVLSNRTSFLFFIYSDDIPLHSKMQIYFSASSLFAYYIIYLLGELVLTALSAAVWILY